MIPTHLNPPQLISMTIAAASRLLVFPTHQNPPQLISMTIAAAAANLLNVLAWIFIAIRKTIQTFGAAANAVCAKKRRQRRPEDSQSQASNLVEIFNQY